ncbi:MAG: hypothetical protein EBR09_16715 [Proteobacteria bacterium]|nr:hypothetical protein [Pseudomonadota bacterium]
MNSVSIEPRRRAAVDIKLLRLELLPRGKTPCETISHEWSPAQPTENLSPDAAADALKVEVWAPQSVVKERYRKLQMRYPPEQFPEKHTLLRPAAELLSDPVLRLNWYWQSGLIPVMWSDRTASESPLWNSETCKGSVTPDSAFLSLYHALKNES